MLTYYYWPAPAGGAENQCRRLSAVLIARGHTCTVLTSRYNRTGFSHEVEKSGVHIVRKLTMEAVIQKIRNPGGDQRLESKDEKYSGDAKKAVVPVLIKFRKKIALWGAYVVRYCNIVVFALGALFFIGRNRHSIDILHVHTADWIAGLGAFASWLFKIPVVCKGADMPVFPPLHAVPLAAFCDIWRRKPRFIALTQAMQADFLQNGVSSKNITVIPNGVPLPNRTVAVKENEDFLYIGNFSQSAAHKGFDLLIAAWAAFHQERPLPRLFLLGGGDAVFWQHLARKLGCIDSIEFAGYQTDLVPFFRKSCCLLLPSRKEGISNALLEAQSWGLPAIVSDIPGNREIVLHESNGLIVPVENSDALATACVHMLDNPLLREQYGNAARKRIEGFYSMDKIADLTTHLYDGLLHQAKA